MSLINKSFLEDVEEFTGNLLSRKDDVHKLISVAIANKREEEFEKLTFTAKYICGMFRVVKKAPGIPEVTSFENIQKDLSENLNKGMEQLKALVALSSNSEQNYFENNYFALTKENFRNLSQLFSDLEAVKKYLNHLKRK